MRERILPLIPTVIILIILYLVSREIEPQVVQTWIESAGIFGPLVIIVLAVIAAVFAPLSGTPLLFVGFLFYGPRIVFLLTLASLASAALNFLISRRWGRPLIIRFVGKKNMATVDRFTVEHGISSLFILRIFMGSLNDFISYGMGLTNMKFKTYYVVTLLGVIPGTLVWYAIAVKANSPTAFTVYTTIFMAVFGAIYLLYRFITRNFKK